MTGICCPWCAAPSDCHDGLDPAAHPGDRDVSVCYRCRRPGVFAVAAGRVTAIRKPTGAEWDELASHAQFQSALAAVSGPLGPHAAVARWRRAAGP